MVTVDPISAAVDLAKQIVAKIHKAMETAAKAAAQGGGGGAAPQFQAVSSHDTLRAAVIAAHEKDSQHLDNATKVLTTISPALRVAIAAAQFAGKVLQDKNLELLDEQRARLVEAEAVAGPAVADLRTKEQVWEAQQAALREVAQLTAKLQSIPGWEGMASSGYGGAATGQITAVTQLVAGSLRMPSSIREVANLNEAIMSNISRAIGRQQRQITKVNPGVPGSFACTHAATTALTGLTLKMDAELGGETTQAKLDEVQGLVDASRSMIPNPWPGS